MVPGTIRFRFSLDKFLNLVTYLASSVPNLDIMKAVKLLYFIDKHHIVRYGRPITGDTYYRLNRGPVPTAAYDIMKIPDPTFDSTGFPDREAFLTYMASDDSRGYPVFTALRAPELNCFSTSEMESIKAVTERLGRLSGYDLMVLSHEDATHKKTGLGAPIDFRLFFEDEPGALSDAFELMESQQEDRDFAQGMMDD